MNYWDQLKRLFRASTVVTHPRDPVLVSWFGGGAQTASGLSVTPEQGMRLAVAGACIRVIAETMASLPLVVYKRREDGGKEPDREHPLFEILHDQPNEHQTSYDFWLMMVASLLSRGNAYAYIESSRRAPVKALIPLEADRVVPFRAPDGSVAYQYTTAKGGTQVYLRSEIFHLRDLSMDGLVGLSRIEQHREAFGLGLAQEEFAARFFGNGTTIGGVLEHPAKLSDEAYNRLKTSWEARHSGATSAHKPAILEEGMKWTALGVPPDQAQFIESRKFQKDEIAMIFRVPPHKVASLDRATFSNIEHQSIEFVTDTIRPIAVLIEKAIRRDLLTTAGKQTHFASFNVMALLRGDSTARANYYKTALGTTQQPGWMTPNEVRELEDMNPIEGGDELTPLITNQAKPADPSADPGVDTPTDAGDENKVRHAGYRVVVPIEVQTPDYTVTKDVTFNEDRDGVIRSGTVVETHRALKS